MAYEVAVLENYWGYTSTLREPSWVVVYERREIEVGIYQWAPIRSREFRLSGPPNPGLIRSQMAELIKFLGDCCVLALVEVSGIAFVELQKAHISIWEIVGMPHELLDRVLAAEVRGKPGFQEEMLSIPQSVEISPGCYRMVLRKMPAGDNESVSRQLLDPVIKFRGLRRLEIFCDYVPSWLEDKIIRGDLTGYINLLQTGEAVITVIAAQKLKDSSGCF